VTEHRSEPDAMGEVRVPADALYGAQTARAAAWAFSGHRLPPAVVHALGRIKAAAARVHGAAGRFPAPMAAAIESAANEVAVGRHDAQFVVDLFQTGSGTSSHMNANEVIANRAAELLGGKRGSGTVHANDHVNLAMSSNDVMPSAVQLAAVEVGDRRLLPALRDLEKAFGELAKRHWDDVRNGRTHLMNAMPVRFGQQFRAAAEVIGAAAALVERAVDDCRDLPLGGTAVGTGVNCPPDFAAAVCAELAQATGLRVRETGRHLGAPATLGPLATLSAALRITAGKLYKLVNDVRWQTSSALRELRSPALQPGSSMMPGKNNPVVCEAVLMACAQVLGNDAAIAFADTQGQFELNTMIPLAARNVLESADLLTGAVAVFRTRVVQDLQPTGEGSSAVRLNPILATALVPEIGHERAAAIAREAAQRGVSVLEVARQRTDLSPERLDQLLDPQRLSGERGGEAGRDSDDAGN
jgi:fumarate hydratase class II